MSSEPESGNSVVAGRISSEPRRGGRPTTWESSQGQSQKVSVTINIYAAETVRHGAQVGQSTRYPETVNVTLPGFSTRELSRSARPTMTASCEKLTRNNWLATK